MGTEHIEKQLREKAGELLANGTVELVIGFEAALSPLFARPAFFSNRKTLQRLRWNALCANNLSVYLSRLKKRRVGLIARGCEQRALVQLVKEKQVDRSLITVIAVPCPGIIDRSKLVADFPEQVEEIITEGESVSIRGKTRTEKRKIEDYLCDSCRRCGSRWASGADVALGDAASFPIQQRTFRSLEPIEKLDAAQRWDYFSSEFDRCIRCYACRDSCPLCYCEQCFVDSAMPRWLSLENNVRQNLLFQLTRTMHLTGRCIGCGACSRACPMGIDVALLTAKMEKEAERLFEYQAGMEIEEPSLLETFRVDDPGEFA